MTHRHKGCTHGAGNAWTIEPTRRYFQHCDSCDVRFPWANHYEVYYVDEDREECCWWRECTKCLIKTISDYAEVWQLERDNTELPPDKNPMLTSLSRDDTINYPLPGMSAGEIQRAESREDTQNTNFHSR